MTKLRELIAQWRKPCPDQWDIDEKKVSIHCFYHPHAELRFKPVEIPQFAQNDYATERIEVRCSIPLCPFITAISKDAFRVCRKCGKKLENESLGDPRCNKCKRKRQNFLDNL